MSRICSKSGLVASALVILALMPSAPAAAQEKAEPTYEKDLRPLFKKHCTACHNQRKLADSDISGGLALDSYEAIQSARQRKAALFSGGAKSILIQKLSAQDEEKRMPQGGAALVATDIAMVRRWLEAGMLRGEPDSGGSAATEEAKSTTSRRRPAKFVTSFLAPKDFMGGFSPKLQLQLPHGAMAPITALSYSPDGKILAVGSYKQIVLWALESVAPKAILADFSGAVHDLHFNSDGKLLLVAGGEAGVEGVASVYDLGLSKWTHTIHVGQDVITTAAFAPTGRTLALGNADKKIYLWNLERGAIARVITSHSDGVTAVAFSPDGQRLLSVAKDRTLKITSPTTGRTQSNISRNEEDLALAFHPTANEAVSAGLNPNISWWDLKTNSRPRQLRAHVAAVNDLAFDRRGTVLASASSDKTLNLWNGHNGALLRTISVTTPLWAVSVQPDGSQVAAGGFDGSTMIWNVADGRLLVTLAAFRDVKGIVQWLAFIPEGYISASQGAKESSMWTNERNFTQSHVWSLLENPNRIAQALANSGSGADTQKRSRGKP